MKAQMIKAITEDLIERHSELTKKIFAMGGHVPSLSNEIDRIERLFIKLNEVTIYTYVAEKIC